MKLSNKVNLYFIALILLNSIFFTTQVLDRTLVPRFLFLSALLLVSIPSFIKNWSTSKFRTLNLLDFLFIIYYVISCISIFYAINIAEAFFENQKILLAFLVYYITRFLLLQTGHTAEKILCQTAAIAVFCGVTYLIWEYSTTEDTRKYFHMYLKGTSSHRNLSAAFLLLCIPFNIIGLWQTKSQLWKWLFRLAILGTIITILVLQTRSVYMASAIASLFAVTALFLTSDLFKQLHLKKIITSSIIIFVSVFLFFYLSDNLSYFSERINIFNYQKSYTAQERLFIWGKTNSLIKDNWLTGVGSGNWKLIFPSYGIGDWKRAAEHGVIFQRPHNDFLWVFSELGITGIFIYSSILLIIFWAGIQTAITHKSKLLGTKLWIVLAGLLAYYIFSCFSFPRERLEHLVLWAVLLAIISYYGHDFFKEKYSLKITNKLKNSYIIIFLTVLLGFNLLIGYHRYKGEKNMKKAYDYNIQKNWGKLKSRVNAAYSPFFYNLDYTSMPLKWFEGTVYHKNQQFDKALDCQLKALEHNPYNDRVLNDIAAIYGEKKDYPKAESFLQRALTINSSRQSSHLNLAFLYFYMKKYDKVKQHLDKVKDQKHDANKNKLLVALQQLGY